MCACVLGFDFGTLSVRALLADLDTGRSVGAAVYTYPQGVLRTIGGVSLPGTYALQHPQDYRDGLCQTVRSLLHYTSVDKRDIVGIGVDCTASTVLPVDDQGSPLCLRPEFASQPQAYIKLWKHHGAADQAARMQRVAVQRQEPWLTRYGGRINAESLLPKAIELAEQAPEVYAACAHYLEAGDWIVSLLTGRIVRSRYNAGCNALYHEEKGYPSDAYLTAVSPAAAGLAAKLGGEMVGLGECAGELTPAMADELGLRAGIAVAAANIDSHAAVPACGADREGDLVVVLGTSACHLLLGHAGQGIPGVYSAVPDALVPGRWGYEAGQSCVGDGFGWFVDHFVPASYTQQAKQAGLDIHQHLSLQAASLRPGESGLLALDWFNGLRSPGMDPDLTGLLLGLTLHTRPEHVYRALLEATALGTRRIIDQYTTYGQPVHRLFAAGGIPKKNALFMQILADVCGQDIPICGQSQASAWGSAICAAAAATRASFAEAMHRLAPPPSHTYVPQQPEAYDALYGEYCRLSAYFAQDNPVMKTLRSL